MAALGKVVSAREQEWVSEMLVKVFLELSAGYTGVFSLKIHQVERLLFAHFSV